MAGAARTSEDIDVDLRRLFASLAANWARILVVAAIVSAIAFALAWMATPRYRAETRLLIEAQESIFTRPDARGDLDSSVLDQEGVASQVEVISSTDIIKRVAKQLDLAKLPEFDETAEMSLLDRILVRTGLRSDPFEIPAEERVLKAFREKLNVYRVENSRVIVISFSSEDPKLAAEIPNALAETYLAMSRDAKQQSNADATDWLKPEIADLTKRVREAESRVAEFRGKSDLLVGQNNSVLATQQLSELSTELSRVRAARASAEATAESVRAALKSGASLDAFPEVLSSGLIQRLRERQVQLKADIADLSTTLLDNHPRIRSLKSQLADLDVQIRNEAGKVLQGLETEAATAKRREDQLVSNLNSLKVESARAGEDEVELRALEREANAQRELLESYLTRYREAASRGERNYLPVDARIFSRAVVPTEPYFPKVLPIVGATFAGTLLLMVIGTLLVELFSGRAMRQVSAVRPDPVAQVEMPEPVRAEDEPLAEPAPVPREPAAAARVESVATPAADRAPRTIAAEQNNMAPVQPAQPARAPAASLDEPLRRQSPLGEIGIERAAERLIASGTGRVVFVSPEGDEAAAASVMVARAIADAGLRVLLLDLTASGAASVPMLDSDTYPGITNLLTAEAQFADVIHADHYSDCHVIPVGTANPIRAMRAADRLPIILESLTTAYDMVVVECGPADAESIRRIMGAEAEIMISVIDPQDMAIIDTADALLQAGHELPTLVTPVGFVYPDAPAPGSRSAA
jgi:exopolysaccharide transport family protein